MKKRGEAHSTPESIKGHAETVLLSADQLASRLGVSARTIWRLASGQRMPSPLRLGRAVRWRSSDIEAWIAAGCPESGNDQQYGHNLH